MVEILFWEICPATKYWFIENTRNMIKTLNMNEMAVFQCKLNLNYNVKGSRLVYRRGLALHPVGHVFSPNSFPTFHRYAISRK